MLGLAIFLLCALILPIFYTFRAIIRCCCGKNNAPISAGVAIHKSVNKAKVVLGTLGVFGIILTCILSTIMGNYAFTKSSPGLVDLPKGFQSIFLNMEPEVTTLIRDTAATVIRPGVLDMNRTVNENVHTAAIADSMSVINSTIGQLPNITEMIEALRHIENVTLSNSTLHKVRSLLDLAEGFDDMANNLRSSMGDMSSFMNDVETSNEDLVTAISKVNSSVVAADNLMVYLFGSSSGGGSSSNGLVNGVYSDVSDVQRSPNGRFPRQSEFNAVSDGSAGTTPRLASGVMNGDVTQQSTMNYRLTLLYQNISNLPNYTTTASNLMLLNDTMRNALSSHGVLANMTSSIQAVQTALNGYPDISSAQGSLTSLYSMIIDKSNQFGNGIDMLNELIDLFSGIPNLIGVLKRNILQINSVDVIRLNLFVVKNELDAVNETLYELPSAMADISSAFDKFNSTLFDVYNDIDSNMQKLDDANDTVVGYLNDGRKYIGELDDVDKSLNASINSYDLVSINSSMSDAIDILASVNFTETLLSIKKLRTALEAVVITQNLVDGLVSFQYVIEKSVNLLRRAVDTTQGGSDGASLGDYLKLTERGYCTNDDSIECQADGDCTGLATCTGAGTFRCAAKGSVACTVDANCTAHSTFCLADTHRANDLTARLVAMGSNALNIDVSDLLTSLDGVKGNDDLSLDTARKSLNDANRGSTITDFSDLNSTITEITDSLNLFNTSLDNIDFDFSNLAIGDILESIEPFESKLKEIKDDYIPLIDDYLGLVNAVISFIFHGELKERLMELRQPVLSEVVETSGPRAMMMHIAAQIDLSSLFFNRSQDAMKFKPTTFEEDLLKNKFLFLDRLGAYKVSGFGDMRGNGAVYYFLRLFNFSTVHAGAPLISGIYVDSNNDRYPDNNDCLLSECEDHSMDVINTYPMQDWQYEFPQADLSMLDSVTYSREELFDLLWIPMLILCFFGIVTLILHCVPGWEKTERVCNCFFTSCICCHLPILLLFTGLFFVFAYSLSDACYTGPFVGEKHLKDGLCTGAFGGEGTVTDCVRTTHLSDAMGGGNITVHMNIRGMYRGFFLSDCPKVDPFATIIQQFADGARDIPENVVIKQLQNTDMREPLRNVSAHIARNSGTLLHNFMYGVSENVVSCSRLAQVFSIMQKETCESYSDPIVWIIAPWYFCTWILILCALPSACMKRKEKKLNAIVPHTSEDGGNQVEVVAMGRNDAYGIKKGEFAKSGDRDDDENPPRMEQADPRFNSGDVDLEMQGHSGNHDSHQHNDHHDQHMGRESAKMMRKLGSDFVQDDPGPDEAGESDN